MRCSSRRRATAWRSRAWPASTTTATGCGAPNATSIFYPMIQAALEAHDTSFDAIREAGGVVEEIGYGDTAQAMQDGRLDRGLLLRTGALQPVAADRERARVPPARLRPTRRWTGTWSCCLARPPARLPAGTYAGQDSDVQVPYLTSIQLVVSADVPGRSRLRDHQGADRELVGQFQDLFAGAEEMRAETALDNNPDRGPSGRRRGTTRKPASRTSTDDVQVGRPGAAATIRRRALPLRRPARRWPPAAAGAGGAAPAGLGDPDLALCSSTLIHFYYRGSTGRRRPCLFRDIKGGGGGGGGGGGWVVPPSLTTALALIFLLFPSLGRHWSQPPGPLRRDHPPAGFVAPLWLGLVTYVSTGPTPGVAACRSGDS